MSSNSHSIDRLILEAVPDSPVAKALNAWADADKERTAASEEKDRIFRALGQTKPGSPEAKELLSQMSPAVVRYIRAARAVVSAREAYEIAYAQCRFS